MQNKLSISDLDLANKKVLMRVDFNVPLDKNVCILYPPTTVTLPPDAIGLLLNVVVEPTQTCVVPIITPGVIGVGVMVAVIKVLLALTQPDKPAVLTDSA